MIISKANIKCLAEDVVRFSINPTQGINQAMCDSFAAKTKKLSVNQRLSVKAQVKQEIKKIGERLKTCQDLTDADESELTTQALELNGHTRNLALELGQTDMSPEYFIEQLDCYYKYDQGQLDHLKAAMVSMQKEQTLLNS